MIIFTLVFVIFASLASAHARPETNLRELKNFALVNVPALSEAVEAFQAAGYYTMGNLSKPILAKILDYKDKIEQFPTNISINDMSNAQYRTFHHMRMFSIQFPLYSNASQLSDGLKAWALVVAVYKTAQNDYRSPNAKLIRNTVFDTIHQETGILARDEGSLRKPDQKLESLYAQLKKYGADIGQLSMISDFTKGLVEMIEDHCQLPSSDCSLRLVESVEKFFRLHKQIKENTPIDDMERINNLLFDILPDYIEIYQEVGKALEADKLMCLLGEDGCKDWPWP